VINGLHIVIYSKDADKDRAFFKEVLKFPNVDAGQGWLIFTAPPSELAIHPAKESGKHEAYLMCDNVEEQVKTLEQAGYSCTPIIDEGWGLLTSFFLPGGGSMGLYEPKHKIPTQII